MGWYGMLNRLDEIHENMFTVIFQFHFLVTFFLLYFLKGKYFICAQVADLFLGICHSGYNTCPFHGDLCRESLLAFQGYQISM